MPTSAWTEKRVDEAIAVVVRLCELPPESKAVVRLRTILAAEFDRAWTDGYNHSEQMKPDLWPSIRQYMLHECHTLVRLLTGDEQVVDEANRRVAEREQLPFDERMDPFAEAAE